LAFSSSLIPLACTRGNGTVMQRKNQQMSTLYMICCVQTVKKHSRVAEYPSHIMKTYEKIEA